MKRKKPIVSKSRSKKSNQNAAKKTAFFKLPKITEKLSVLSKASTHTHNKLSAKKQLFALPQSLFTKISGFLSTHINQKRGRGRPKKLKLLVALDTIRNNAKIHRHRGRPKKMETHIKTFAPVAAIMPKRSRGRPKKNYFLETPPIKTGISILKPPFYLLRFFPLQTLFILTLSVSIFFGAYALSEYVFKDLPAVTELTNREQQVTTKITDRTGEILFKVYDDENRSIITLKDVPQTMINATIAIEDKDFYHHYGFSLRGIFRAAIANAKNESVQGGSTLTQQLVKNRLLSSEKTLTRKIRELILSVIVEQQFTKNQILEMYFNQIAYGGSTYGVEEAAQRYFGKSAKEMTLAESALLAGIPAAPSVYTPFGPTPEFAYGRQAEVLRRMVEDGYISNEQAEQAKQEKIAFRNDTIDIKAPHFVMYVRNLLAEKYGEDVVNNGGLIVTTSLDSALQKETQALVTDEVARLERLRVTNGASLITNPQTGEILAMIGSTNYFNFAQDGQVNVTTRERQPGSSIKPLTYAIALERGKTPSTRIQDAPITFNSQGSPPYTPKNYDGKFHGNVTLKESLGSSYNIPAVKLLAEIGLDSYINKAQKMGISTWTNKNRYGLSLTLGGGEVKMIDMNKMYGAFANGGYAIDPNPILEVKNYKGEILYRNECALDKKNCKTNKVLDEGVAYLITSMLFDNTARTPAFGPLSTLFIPNHQVAVKTGTTNNLRDNWTFGYTSDRLVSVWVGNNDNTPMSYIASGVTGASTIWNNIMQLMLDDKNPHAFSIPSNIAKVSICTTTNAANCGNCRTSREEYFIRSTEPKNTCEIIGAQPTINTNRPQASPRAIVRKRDVNNSQITN